MAEWWSSAFPLLLIAAALFINEWITMPTCTTSGHRSNAGMRRSGDLRVMMVSDLLLGGPDTDLAKRLIRQTFMSKALRKSVEMVRPDMIVVLGDLSAGGSDSEVEKWLGELQEFQWMLGPYVGLPLHVVLGERDMGRCGELDEGFIGGIAGYLPGMDSAGCGAFEMKNVTFVSLNGVALQCKEGQLRFGVERVIERKSMELRSRVQEVDANGDFGVDVFQWRDNRVEPGSGPVVLVHFPLHHRGVDYAGGTSSTEDDFWIASSRAFGSYNDGIVFSAHTYSFHDQIHSDGTREVTVPALTWAPGIQPGFVVSTFGENKAVFVEICSFPGLSGLAMCCKCCVSIILMLMTMALAKRYLHLVNIDLR